MRPAALISLLLAAIALWGCSEEKDSPTAPQASVETAQLVPILTALLDAVEGIEVVDLLTGGQQIEGVQGTLNLTATQWTFDGYSPDGLTVLDGQLAANLLASPATLQGDLEIDGELQGDLRVDFTFDLSADEPELGGSLTFEGVQISAADLVAAAQLVGDGTD